MNTYEGLPRRQMGGSFYAQWDRIHSSVDEDDQVLQKPLRVSNAYDDASHLARKSPHL